MSRFERNKDLVQEVVSSTAEHVGEIARIVATAVADVTAQLGAIATDAFDMREAAARAEHDEHRDSDAAAVADSD